MEPDRLHPRFNPLEQPQCFGELWCDRWDSHSHVCDVWSRSTLIWYSFSSRCVRNSKGNFWVLHVVTMGPTSQMFFSGLSFSSSPLSSCPPSLNNSRRRDTFPPRWDIFEICCVTSYGTILYMLRHFKTWVTGLHSSLDNSHSVTVSVGPI